uniref:Uncharacterized protein n=1 Tax=Corethron hystrix TaxID=216773 RepID=A0A7S1C0X0_9STRA
MAACESQRRHVSARLTSAARTASKYYYRGHETQLHRQQTAYDSKYISRLDLYFARERLRKRVPDNSDQYALPYISGELANTEAACHLPQHERKQNRGSERRGEIRGAYLRRHARNGDDQGRRQKNAQKAAQGAVHDGHGGVAAADGGEDDRRGDGRGETSEHKQARRQAR